MFDFFRGGRDVLRLVEYANSELLGPMSIGDHWGWGEKLSWGKIRQQTNLLMQMSTTT